MKDKKQDFILYNANEMKHRKGPKGLKNHGTKKRPSSFVLLLLLLLIGVGTYYYINGSNFNHNNIPKKSADSTESDSAANENLSANSNKQNATDKETEVSQNQNTGNNSSNSQSTNESGNSSGSMIDQNSNTKDQNSNTKDQNSNTKDQNTNTKEQNNHSQEQSGNNESIDQSPSTVSPDQTTDNENINQNGENQELSNSADNVQEVFESGTKKRDAVKVRGIYVSGQKAGSDGMNDLINLVDSTELNAMVIDIKNDKGEVTYDMDIAAVQKFGADKHYISDIKQLVKKLKKKNIYLIARIVCFKDPILAKSRSDLCIKNKDGSLYKDNSGIYWVNPYKKETWNYIVAIARQAALLGFDEIQFDYIRFSTDSGMKNVSFGKEAKNTSKTEIITGFTKFATEKLKTYGVFVSADVYGTIIDSKVDSAIVGQSYADMAKYLDYICPMIYPSHYADGSYGISHPDLKPYKLIYKVAEKSKTALKSVSSKKAIVRPWLQDFTATWLSNHQAYGSEEIRAQIQALYDAGYDEWILWNGSNNYTKSALKK